MNAAPITQPGVADGATVFVGSGVAVAGTGVFVAGGGSVLTRIPLNGNGVSVGTGVGVPVADPELHAVSKAASTMMMGVFLICFPIQ